MRILIVLFFITNYCYSQELSSSCVNKIINSEVHFGIDEFNKQSQNRNVKLYNNINVKSIHYVELDRGQNVSYNYFYVFNDKQNITRLKIEFVGFKEYNKDKFLKYEGNKILAEMDSVGNKTTTYQYINNYRLKKIFNKQSNQFVLSDSLVYDKANNIKEVVFFDQSVQNNITSLTTITHKEIIKKSFANNKLHKTEYFKLVVDANCSLLLIDNLEQKRKTVLNFDPFGNLILKSLINYSNNLEKTITKQAYYYKLDEYKNWVERYTVLEDKKVLVSKRIIKYN